VLPRGREAGFTLIEVLVVTAILSILATLAVVSLTRALDRARQRATMGDMRTVCRALESYSVDNDRLPSDSGGLAALRTAMVPYATQVLPTVDHWGHDLVYEVAANGVDYSLISYGKDGADGADFASSIFDYDADIVLFSGVFIAAPE
jgi:general secretion pathway protein G